METQRKPKRKIAAGIAIAVAAVLIIVYVTNVYAAKPEEDADALLREYPVSRGDITAGVDGAGALAMDGTPHQFDSAVVIGE